MIQTVYNLCFLDQEVKMGANFSVYKMLIESSEILYLEDAERHEINNKPTYPLN